MAFKERREGYLLCRATAGVCTANEKRAVSGLPLKGDLQWAWATYPEPGVQGGRLRSGTGWTSRDLRSIGSRECQPNGFGIGSRYFGAHVLTTAGLRSFYPKARQTQVCGGFLRAFGM